jgi:plastocyanin
MGTAITRCTLLAAMLGGVGALATGPVASAAEAQVMIDNFSFSPAELTVARGTRVTWTNRDDIPHTVTSRAEPRVLKSPALDTEDSFAVTLDTPGAYHYFCMLHPHMQGTVIVR